MVNPVVKMRPHPAAHNDYPTTRNPPPLPLPVVTVRETNGTYQFFHYIDTDEITGFFLSIKNHIFIARSQDTIFIFHV